ncbi:MAG: hypothetical protein IKI63_06980, partial [Clostridia bacterium]|nr:hypothetical protein [Clostridia bacterium]
MVAVGPVPPERQYRLRKRLSRTSAVWLITIPGAVVCLMLAAFEMCSTLQEIREVSAAFLIVLALCLMWVAFMKGFRGLRSAPLALWSDVRINELHPQGAVSRGANGTIVLPFEDVILYEETADGLALCGRGGVILWSADDLTPAAATAIQLYLRARVPGAAVQIRDTFQARAATLRLLPNLPQRGACHAEATAETRPRKIAALTLGQAMVRST